MRWLKISDTPPPKIDDKWVCFKDVELNWRHAFRYIEDLKTWIDEEYISYDVSKMEWLDESEPDQDKLWDNLFTLADEDIVRKSLRISLTSVRGTSSHSSAQIHFLFFQLDTQ
jgi:hypothetical protein